MVMKRECQLKADLAAAKPWSTHSDVEQHAGTVVPSLAPGFPEASLVGLCCPLRTQPLKCCRTAGVGWRQWQRVVVNALSSLKPRIASGYRWRA